jgi:K+ transporter
MLNQSDDLTFVTAVRLCGAAGYFWTAPTCARGRYAIDLSDTTYCRARDRGPAEDREALPRVTEAMFALMQRNSANLTDYFRLPIDAVVEICREVLI